MLMTKNKMHKIVATTAHRYATVAMHFAVQIGQYPNFKGAKVISLYWQGVFQPKNAAHTVFSNTNTAMPVPR